MHRQHNRRIQRRHNILRQGRAQTLHLVAHAGDCFNELAVLLPRTTNLSAHIVAGCLRRGESTQHGVILLRADGLTAGQGGRPESSRVVRCRAGCTVGGAVLGGSCLICRFVGGHGSSFSCSSLSAATRCGWSGKASSLVDALRGLQATPVPPQVSGSNYSADSVAAESVSAAASFCAVPFCSSAISFARAA